MTVTFADKFRDPASDPFSGHYQSLYHVHRTRDGAPTAGQLLSQISAADARQYLSYVGLYHDGPYVTGRTRLVHTIQRYAASLGHTSQWDNKTFAFVGDVEDGEITTVELQEGAFDISPEIRVPATVDRTDELLADEPDLELLSELLDTAPSTEISKARKLVLVPARYVPLLANRRLTPRRFWTDVVGAIRNDNQEAECAALIQWGKVALMQHAGGPPGVLHQVDPQVPLMDKDLRAHRRTLLHGHLPELAAGTIAATTAAGHAQLAGLVGQLVAEQQLARQEAQTRSDASQAPKSPAKHWGTEACRFLCLLCDQVDEALLPPVWAAIAAAPKKDRQAIEFEVTSTARSLGQVGYAPLITPDLARKITALRFDGDNMDDLCEGLQPFALVIPDNTSTASASLVTDANHRIMDYDTVSTASSHTTLSDAKALRGAGKATLVRDYPTVRALLIAVHILLRTLLGVDQPMVKALADMVTAYSNQELFYQGRLRNVLGWTPGQSSQHGPALLLRAVQLRITNYFRRYRMHGVLPGAPRFTELLDDLATGSSSWLPVLPHSYRQALGGNARKVASDAGSSSTASTVSDLTAGSAGSGSADSAAKRTTIANPKLNTKFDPYRALIGKATITEAIAKGGTPPTVERDGKSVPMCMHYHLKGSCFSNCPRRADHAAHTSAEDEALDTWCQAAYKE